MADWEDDFEFYPPSVKPDPRGSWRQRVQQLRDERGNKCESCEEPERWTKGKCNLQFAHVKPTGLNGVGRGQTQRYLDIKRNPGSYKLLCAGCHRAVGNPERT